ncbi:MFS transporter [Gordonia sp. zg691]|uniref:MFS transporter n=1 Tax=Gordonia jinghuaiqii TaxID=2758710 RepID=A0A7D7LUZ4_9ACTN|nr:MFS transporter [Gordonia jinghuaiqii]MBD0863431.1 MFS transporter [Gordonia jinghuaiqii]MCR5979162.1 MFS transporter [Gordonia jinghuaiqii]QMT04023.1 MFS transporter [Gordonia jinghuaiqii]
MACLGVFVAYLPITSVAVSLPAIGEAFGASTAQLSWVQDAFVLPMAAFILTAGVFGDVHGRRKVYLVGLSLTAIGGLVALCAQSIVQVWIGQAIAGTGAAALLPTTLAMISHAVPDFRERGKFIGIWASSLMLSLTLGSLVAGPVAESAGWRWIYLMPIPVALVALAVSIATLPDSRAPHARRLDWPGQISAAVAVTALVFGVIEAGVEGLGDPKVVVAFVVAVIAAVTFVVVERRSDSPMLDLDLFRSRAFTVTTLIAMISFLALIGFIFVLSMYFGMVQQLTTVEAGWRLSVMNGASMAVGALAGKMMHQIQARFMIGGGLAMVAVAQFALLDLDAETSFASISWRLIILGLGMGLVMAPMTATAVSSVPYHLAGMAAAGNNTFRQVGGALGPAVLGALLTAGAVNALPDELADAGIDGAMRDRVVSAVDGEGLAAVSGLDLGADTPTVMGAVGNAFLQGMHLCLIFSGVLTAAAAVLCLVMLRPQQSPQETPPATP